MKQEVARYDYTDIAGNLRFCKVRYEPKDFRWGKLLRWDDDIPVLTRGIPSADGAEWGRVIYRLPEVATALWADAPVVICEGEKDSDAMVAATGVACTSATNPVRPRVEQAEWFAKFRTNSDLVIAADQDLPGAKAAWTWYQNLLAVGVAERRITVVTPKRRRHKDVSDVLDTGLRLDGFREVDLGRLADAATQRGPTSTRSHVLPQAGDDNGYPGLVFEPGLGWVNPRTDYVVQFDRAIRDWKPTRDHSAEPRRGKHRGSRGT